MRVIVYTQKVHQFFLFVLYQFVCMQKADKLLQLFHLLLYNYLCSLFIAALSHADHVISGQVKLGTQYHYHMETHTVVVEPHEGGFKVQSATQWVTRVQAAVAMVMNIPVSSVDVSVKRVGGSFGAKTTRPNMVAAACALGASITGR